MEDLEYFQKLSPEDRLVNIRLWIRARLEEYASELRDLASVHEEHDAEVENLLMTSLEELPTLINSYEEDTPCHEILKYRIAQGIEEGTELVDTPWYAEMTLRHIPKELYDSDSQRFTDAVRGLIDLSEVAAITADEELLRTVERWIPHDRL